VSQTAIGTGTSFSVLKDPVLASNGAFAFPATLKPTRTVRGPATQTLWWRPAGGALTLLAQGGGAASDLSGPKWKAFTSLAIAADRGPIFTATLTPAATGVWACDYSHAPRLLFQTGSQLDVGTPGTPVVKTVKSFELLSAAVGTSGVTRSFNDNAQVVWLATFMDKSQAIVTTEVP
jgi:hypothetical protein